MTESQRKAIITIKELFESKNPLNLKTMANVNLKELKTIVSEVKDWCKYNLSKNLKKEIGKGAYGTVYKGCINNSCEPPMVIRVIEYDSAYETAPSKERPENVEWIIHNELYKYLKSRNVYNITIPIFSYSCKVSELNSEIRSKIIDTFVPPKCVRITFTDFANGGSLESTLEKSYIIYNDRQLLHIILQILLTLCTIYEKYPNYRHNDLHIGNILIFNTREYMENLNYTIEGKRYELKTFNMLALLNDFDFNSIYPRFPNVKVKRLLPDVHKVPSSYYDVHKFINSLLTLPKEKAFQGISTETMNFLKSIVPSFLRGRKRGAFSDFYQVQNSREFERVCEEEKFNYRSFTPDQLIKNKIFKDILL